MSTETRKRLPWIVISFSVGLASMWVVSMAHRDKEATSLMHGREQTRQVAPNRSAVAFVWLPDISGSVMVSQPYQVWIESRQASKKLRILEADKTDSISLAWRGSELLDICYSDAHITHFKNRFVMTEQNSPQVREVEIVLRKVQKQSDCGT